MSIDFGAWVILFSTFEPINHVELNQIESLTNAAMAAFNCRKDFI